MNQSKVIKRIQSLKADKGAIRAWVRRKTLEESDKDTLSLEQRDDVLTLTMGERHIARLVDSEGRWRIQRFESAVKWNWTDDKDNLTPVIPMLLVDEDADGWFQSSSSHD